jgi:predicted AAA+ superfamily ATPase
MAFDKELIKRIIVEKQHEVIENVIIKRNIELEPSANYVFIGLRRAGKSYLMFQHIQHLIKTEQASKEDILYINFEDERISTIQAEDLGVLLDAYGELFASPTSPDKHTKKPILFLDEIQNIAGWEKFARRVADAKYRIFITCSNAKMLSKEIYTTLGGRFIAKEIYPFSFAEYLDYHGVALAKNWEYGDLPNKIFKLFENYFYYGGFAESFAMNDKRSWLNALYQKILLGDIVLRNDIRNENAIRVLAKKLAESVMQPSSLSRINNVVNASGASIARNTMVDYLHHLADAYLIFGISNYSDTLSERETFKKRYFFDNGLLNNFLIDPETKLLENLVAIELKKRYGEDLFYYNRNVEVDFFVPKEKLAVQASYSLSDDATRRREVQALVKLAKVADLTTLEIVTFNEERSIEEHGLSIRVVPVWKWLLG